MPPALQSWLRPRGIFSFDSAADIALVDFAVIADVADDARGPVLGQAELLAVGAFGADQPHHVGLLRLQRLIDVLRGDAEFLGVDHRIERPFHDHHPVVVALPHHRRQRLLGDDVGQDDVVVRLREVEPQRIKLGDVGGEGVALAGIIGLDDFVQLGELHLLVFHVVGAEIVGEVELRRGSRLHADLAAVRDRARNRCCATRGSMKPSPS